MVTASYPLVSVVMPAYNHADFVEQALRSVIDQDYSNMELIVIDDGSTDATPVLIEKILSNTDLPHQFIQQENRGAHRALNRGTKLAKGEFITILNSDDYYHPGRIRTFVEHAMQSGAHFLFSKVTHVDERGKTLGYYVPEVKKYRLSLIYKDHFPTRNFELLRFNYAVTTGNFFFHRSLFDQIGGFKNYRLCHDWAFILETLVWEEPYFLDQSLMSYRLHGGNTIIVDNPENDLGEKETELVLANYLQKAENPINRLAPCRRNWGRYWTYFVRRYMPFAAAFETLQPFLS